MAPPKRELVAVLSMLVYTLAGFAVWWKTTEISRPTLPLDDMWSIQQDPRLYATARLRPLLTFYVVSGGDHIVSEVVAHAWVNNASRQLAKAMDVTHEAVGLQLVLHTTGGCQRLHSPAGASSHSWQTSDCVTLPATETLSKQNPAQLDAALEKALSAAGGDWSQPGQAVIFLLPDASLPAPDMQLVLGQHRHGWLRHPTSTGGATAARLALSAHMATLASALMLNDGGPPARRLPISGAGQVQLAFSLCNADSSAQPLTWDFDALEVGYLQAVAQALEPVAQVAISSQVLHYAPAAVEPSWSDAHAAYVVANSQLPFFVDSRWNLHTGSTSFGSGTTGRPPAATPASLGSSASPAAGQCPSDAAEDCLPAAPPAGQGSSSDAGSSVPAAGQGAAAGAAGKGPSPAAEQPQEVGSHIPPHVLHFVVYVPPPQHRPLRVLLRNGSASPTNSFWIPSWGGVIVLDPLVDSPVDPAPRTSAPSAQPPSVQQLSADDLHHIAKVAVAQLHAQLGLPAHKPLQPAASPPSGSGKAAQASPLQVVHVPAARAGLAGWQVDALVRLATAANLVGAASKLGNLSALVQELPNLEMPQLIGDQVAAALGELRAAMRLAAAGSQRAAAGAARAARTHAEAAFFHPAVLAQFNFPDSHKLGIYMPFFLPVGAAILRGVVRELAGARQRWRTRAPGV